MNRQKQHRGAAAALAVLVLAAVLFFVGGSWLEKRSQKPELKIDRDTMAEVTVLGMLGNPVGTTQMQISLAHGFGDGKEESCGYARDAVSRLLQGENIDFYLAMSLDGISVLNDLAGGVTVTLEDDFSAADPAMTKGATLTLQGDQAEIFVRRRMDIGEGTNEARMVRQEEYLAQLSAQLESRVQQDQQFTAQVYDALQPYLVTDLAKGPLHWRASIRWQRTDSPSSIRPKLPSRKRF